MASEDKKQALAIYREASAKIENRVRVNAPILKALHIDPDHFQRVALNALLTTPALCRCTGPSLEKAVVLCAESGLLPDGREAAIVPYKTNAQFIPMVDGMRKLGREATPGLALRDRLVFLSDQWEYREGLYPVLNHVYGTGPQGDADVIAGYAVAHFPGATVPEFIVMTRAQILRHKGFSAFPDGPWKSHFQEMARKTLVKQLLKRLPKSRSLPTMSKEAESVSVTGFPDGAPPMATVTVDLTPDERGHNPAEALPGRHADPDTGEIEFGSTDPTPAEQEVNEAEAEDAERLADEQAATEALAESDGDNEALF